MSLFYYTMSIPAQPLTDSRTHRQAPSAHTAHAFVHGTLDSQPYP